MYKIVLRGFRYFHHSISCFIREREEIRNGEDQGARIEAEEQGGFVGLAEGFEGGTRAASGGEGDRWRCQQTIQNQAAIAATFVCPLDVIKTRLQVHGLPELHPSHKDDVDSTSEERRPELYVECLLYIDGAAFGIPMRTRLESLGPSYCWNELITLSTKYRDLTANSQLAVTVYDVSWGKSDEVVGGATIHLFNMKKQLKTGDV